MNGEKERVTYVFVTKSVGNCVFVTKFRVETYSKEKVVLNLCGLTNIEGDIVSASVLLRRP